MLSQLTLPTVTPITVEVFESSILLHFYSCTVPISSAFYKIHMLINLTDKLQLPKNGHVNEAVVRIVDKKTKGLIIISLTFNIRQLPAIDKIT